MHDSNEKEVKQEVEQPKEKPMTWGEFREKFNRASRRKLLAKAKKDKKK